MSTTDASAPAPAPSAETLEAVLTRNLAHTYGLDGHAANVIARERLAAFDALAAAHVPVFAGLQRFLDGVRSMVDRPERQRRRR